MYRADYFSPKKNVTFLIREDQLAWLDDLQRESLEETVPSRSSTLRHCIDLLRTMISEDYDRKAAAADEPD